MIVLGRKPGGGGSGPGGGVTSVAKSGDSGLTGAVTLSEGSGVTLTQVGQDIEIASTGGGYVLIQEIVVAAGGAATADFQNIPGSYRELVVYVSAYTENVAAQNLQMQFNGDSGANYSYQFASVANATFSGANAGAQTSTLAGLLAATGAAPPYSGIIVIPAYSRTVMTKAFTADSGTAGTRTWWSGSWNNTAAITRITFSSGASDIKESSVFTLYGVG